MVKTFTLSNSNVIPSIGFGTYKISDEKQVYESINHALENGYKMIDTAYFYKNEHFIGEALKNSNAKREDLILATKVWPSDFGYDNTMFSIERSLKLLKTNYIDIMYLHWPGDDMEQSWRAFERMHDEKAIKNIAISNFLPKHYEKLCLKANIKPVINQIELHPYNQQEELQEYYKSQNVQIVSWSPLAKSSEKLFKDSLILELCKKYQKTPAQIILKWHIQKGFIVIPKTITPSRIKENIDIFNFEIDDEDINKIKSFDTKSTISNTPANEDWLRSIRYSN